MRANNEKKNQAAEPGFFASLFSNLEDGDDDEDDSDDDDVSMSVSMDTDPAFFDNLFGGKKKK